MLMMLILALTFALATSTNAIIDSCTLNNPQNNQYDGGLIRYNVTAVWTNKSMPSGRANITNVTITVGSTVYANSTINGTKTNISLASGSANVDTFAGDFTFTISSSQLQADRSYGVFATCYNHTLDDGAVSINSSNNTYTIDNINPTVTIQSPSAGQTISAKGTGLVLIEYTPIEVNLGNSTYYINGERQTSTTSGTTSPNITSGSRKNTFTKIFGGNNNSITLRVEATDLAGLKTNSSTTTFNVFREGAAEPAKVFVTPSGEVISTPAEPKGKAITKPLTFGNIGNVENLLSNPLVWGGTILATVGSFIWWQNRKRKK